MAGIRRVRAGCGRSGRVRGRDGYRAAGRRPGRGGEHKGEVDIGAAGHRRVQPLPVLAAGDQRDAGVHGGALGGVPGDRVGEIGCLVAVIAEGPVGEPALPGRGVGVEQAADHDAAAGDRLDPQHVPVGQGPARFARLETVVVGPADDQVPGGGFGAVGDPDGPAVVDQAEVDQVVADPPGEFPAAGPVRSHQQNIASGQVAGDVSAGGLVHGVVGRGAADAAVLVVLIQRGGVPAAEAEGGGAFPGGGEPDGFGELDVPEPVREQHHGAAAFDRGELFLVSGEDQLAPVAGGVLGDRGQVGDGDHGAFVGQDQGARRDAAALDVGEQPGGVRDDADAGRAELVGGVLGGGGADHRAVPDPGCGGLDAGLAGTGRAGDHLDGAGGGQDVPDGGSLVYA